MKKSKNPFVKKIELRRDVVKFIFDIRLYQKIMTSDDKDQFLNKNKYFEYMRRYNNFLERIDTFIEGAKNGLINLGVLTPYGDDLYKDVRRYSDNEEEQFAINKIIDEIDYFCLCCPGIATLCTELMILIDKSACNGHILSISEEKLYSKKIEELLSLLPYANFSSEKTYLTEHFYRDNWYTAYFFKDDVKNDIQANFRDLIDAMISKDICCQDLLIRYVKVGAVLEKDVLLQLIQNMNRNISVKNILKFLGEEKISLAFSLEEFVMEYFESVKEENEKAQRNKLTNLLLSLLIIGNHIDVLSYVSKAFVTCCIDDFVRLNVAADLLEAYPDEYNYTIFNYFYGIAKDDTKNEKRKLARVLANDKGEE